MKKPFFEINISKEHKSFKEDYRLRENIGNKLSISLKQYEQEMIKLLEILSDYERENNNEMLLHDEGIRFDASFEALSGLNPITEDGVITAGNASQITDGAAAVLVCNDAGLKKVKADPMVKVKAISVVGDDPIYMLTGPIPATHKVLEAAKMKIDEIGLYEVNEAFAPVPLAWEIEVGADQEKLNVNGGAMALGHPLGATGAKLMTTLIYEMYRRDVKYGLQAICEGGGTANATILEKI